MLPLDGLRIQDGESGGIFTKKYFFAITNPEQR